MYRVPETVDILTTLSRRYAAYHNVTYTAEALESAKAEPDGTPTFRGR